MFDIAPTELLVVAIVALVFIGPKELPGVMRVVGQWVGRARGMARHFRSGIDTMIRESELEEMEKKWRDENARIMREFPTADAVTPQIAGPDAPAAADEAPPPAADATSNWGQYDPPAAAPAPPAGPDEKRELP